ncbi:LysM domain-containing protein [Colletotrichum eremochloae]|nr:LysM domain-containing protein [Colletotrichum eremochloae]
MASSSSLYRFFWASMLMLGLFTRFALGDKLLTTDILPDGLSTGCINALTADIACSEGITTFKRGEYYTRTRLKALCVDTCASALASFHGNVVASCAADVWPEEMEVDMPLVMISELLRYNYNLTCLSHDGHFCNNAAAAFLASRDPEAVNIPGAWPAGGDFGDYVPSDTCDRCLVKNLEFQAGSPYFDGPRLQAESVYESRTASCGIVGAPLTTTTLSLFTPTTAAPTPTPTCNGKTYAIQAGDDCKSISQSQSIGTDWLLWDNKLMAFCHQFPSEGQLCLVNTCDTYTILESDTCDKIAKAHGISVTQLQAWNPSLDAGCYNLNQTTGYQLCVSKPGERYEAPKPTTLQPSIPLTAAPVPTNVAADTNRYCGRYYKAVLGDFCNLITMKFGISLSDFIFLNPAINENCTNLYAEESYCVQPVGDLNTYPGKPGHATFSLTVTGSIEDTATDLPDVVWVSPTPTATQIPVATGSREDCLTYLKGEDWQKDLSGTYLISNCDLVATVFGVTLQDLEVWNPSLGNTSDPGCSFASGFRYCGKWYKGVQKPKEAGKMDSNLPSRDGMTSNCTDIVDVDSNGEPTCQDILTDYSLTIAQFYEWNPSVGPDCGGMWAGYHYCVRTPDFVEPADPTPTTTLAPTTTAASTSTAPTPPGPTHPGQPANCNKWHVVTGGDCSTVEALYGLTHAQFLAWNPAVSQDCLTNFWAGSAYCVGTSSPSGGATATTTRAATSVSSTAPASTPTNGPVAAPEPNQAGNAIATCNKYAQAPSGDWCAAFIERNGLVAADFYKWNSVLGTNGQNCGSSFWGTYWYCIGVV